jgi:hypothetical protein
MSDTKEENLPLREKLRGQLGTARWPDLKDQFVKGSLFVVCERIGLLNAAVAVAEDDKEAVEAWIESGDVYRPTEQEVTLWDKKPESLFAFIVLQPFVFIGRPSHTVKDLPN